MAKIYPLAALAVLFGLLFTSCSKDREAEKPVYLSIPEILLTTDYISEGTSSNKITTVWIVVNGDPAGVFEIPCTVPVLLNEGNNRITLHPGINLNGITSTRAIYEGYESMNFDLTYSPSGKATADTLLIEEANRTTKYLDRITVNVFEDFDGTGLNLEKTPRSDTNIRKTSDTTEIFINSQNPNEDNGKAGVLYVTKSRDFGEIATTEEFQLPIGGANVYLEMNYKCNIPFIVGVIANNPDGIVQQPTYAVAPKEDWNKIYINLVTEVSANNNASGYKIFFMAEHIEGVDTGKVFMDNLKLVY